MKIHRWSKTAGNNNSTSPDGAPEGWSGADVNNTIREGMAQTKTQVEEIEYFDYFYELATSGAASWTYSAGTLTLASKDGSAILKTGRRLKVRQTADSEAGTVAYVYCTADGVYSAGNTTVTVETASGSSAPVASPGQVLAATGSHLRKTAFTLPGAGNGLDADTVDTYHAADIAGWGRNALINGGFDVWQRNTTFALSVATRTYTADRFACTANGAGITVARATAPTGAISRYAAQLTGAASVTTVELGQRIEARDVYGLSGTVTFQALIENGTGASLTPTLLVKTPAAEDDWTTPTTRLTQALTAIGSGSVAQVTHTVDVSGYTNVLNGISFELQFPSGALDSGAKTIKVTDVQVARSSSQMRFERRPLSVEIGLCRRYFTKSLDIETAVGTNTTANMIEGGVAGGGAFRLCVQYPVSMRSDPAKTLWSTGATGTSGYVSQEGTDVFPGITSAGRDRFTNENASGRVSFQYTADAEL